MILVMAYLLNVSNLASLKISFEIRLSIEFVLKENQDSESKMLGKELFNP